MTAGYDVGGLRLDQLCLLLGEPFGDRGKRKF